MSLTLLFLLTMVPGTLFLGLNDVLTKKLLAYPIHERLLLAISFAGVSGQETGWFSYYDRRYCTHRYRDYKNERLRKSFIPHIKRDAPQTSGLRSA